MKQRVEIQNNLTKTSTAFPKTAFFCVSRRFAIFTQKMPFPATTDVGYQRLGFTQHIFEDSIVVTADTGFANEDNMKYLHDNKFRSRNPKFSKQKQKYGRRHQDKKSKSKNGFPASEFTFDPITKICICPEGNAMGFLQETKKNENHKIYFEGKLIDCRHCKSKHHCMRNPDSASTLELLRCSLSTFFLRSGRTRLGIVDKSFLFLERK